MEEQQKNPRHSSLDKTRDKSGQEKEIQQFKEHVRHNKTAYMALGLVLVFVIVGAVIRETASLLGDAGTLEVRAYRTGLTVSVDGAVHDVTRATGTVAFRLPVGEHEIGIKRQGFWPWKKTVTIEKDMTTTIAPFNLPQQARLAPLEAGVGSDKPKSRSLFSVNKDRDNPENPLLSDNETLAIYQNDIGIFAEWRGPTSSMPSYFCLPVRDESTQTGVEDVCNKTLLVTTLKRSVRSIHFMPGRDDVLLLTTRDGIFGLELDQRPVQNYQPLLEHRGSDMRRRDDTSIYIRADGATFIATIY